MPNLSEAPRSNLFKVPVQPTYTGPIVPTAYDPLWRKYTNLTNAQRAAFLSMPETLQQVARDWRHSQVLGVIPKITPDMTVNQVIAALDKAKAEAAAPYATEQTVLAGIGKTITTQDHVVAAFKTQ